MNSMWRAEEKRKVRNWKVAVCGLWQYGIGNFIYLITRSRDIMQARDTHDLIHPQPVKA
jgi:hypothetical protein